MENGYQRDVPFSLSEVARAQHLYDEDREVESLDLVERLLGLGDDADADASRLHAEIGPDPSHATAKVFKALLTLRSKCFPAILDAADKECPNLVERALHQLALVDALYPGDAYLVTVSAQVWFFFRRYGHALGMTLEALETDPANETAKHTREIILENLPDDDWEQLTQCAVLLIQHAMNTAPDAKAVDRQALERAHSLLQRSLDVEEEQALGWAAYGWLLFIFNAPAESTGCLQRAKALDPEGSEPLIDAVIDLCKQRGAWRA